MRVYKLGLIMIVIAMIGVFQLSNAHAVGSAGYENASFSTRSLSRSNAVVADPGGPDTIAFNPAGLAKVKGIETYSGVHLITVEGKYEGADGRSDEQASETVVPIPTFYGSYETPLDGLTVGMGADAPFGLMTKYNSTGNFRHIGYWNEIKTAAYHLSAGYEMTPWLSVGGGLTYMKTRVKQLGKFNQGFLGVPGDPDAPFEFDVDGSGYGYNLGLLLELDEKQTIGLSYRSQVATKLKGEMNTDGLVSLAGTFGGATNTTSADTDYTFPANITLGYNHKVTDKLDLELDIGWTDWSVYDSVDIAFGTSNAVLAGFEKINRDYEDTWSVNAGFSYEVDPQTILNGGYFFYERAANKNTYSNENPDGDRHAWSLGVEFKNGDMSFDFMYIFQIISEVEIENVTGVSNGTDIDGSYFSIVQIMSAGLSYEF